MASCEKCLVYPVKINGIDYSEKEKMINVEVEDFYELKVLADYFKKPLLYTDTHYLIIFDNHVCYRTKKSMF